jgi:hypothetical protein
MPAGPNYPEIAPILLYAGYGRGTAAYGIMPLSARSSGAFVALMSDCLRAGRSLWQPVAVAGWLPGLGGERAQPGGRKPILSRTRAIVASAIA